MANFDERAFTQLFFPVPRKWRDHAQTPCYLITRGETATVIDTYGMDEDLSRWVGQPASAAQNVLGKRAVVVPVERLQELEATLLAPPVTPARWERARDRLGRKALGIRPEHFLIRSRALKMLSKRRPLSLAFRFKEFPDTATWILFREGQVQGCQDIGLVSKQERDWGKMVHEAVALPTWTVEMSWELWNQLMAHPKPWKAISRAWRRGEIAIGSSSASTPNGSALGVPVRRGTLRAWLVWSHWAS